MGVLRMELRTVKVDIVSINLFIDTLVHPDCAKYAAYSVISITCRKII
jgi:hypothetical protein